MGIKVQTDQTGANQNVCSGTSLTFNFSLSTNYTLDNADFVIKKGSGTTASIVATVYDQKNGAGNVVATVSILAASVTQSFTTIIFNFNTNLSADVSYSLVVSSTSSCVGSAPYSMKSGNFQVLDSDTNTVINTGYGISTNTNSISTVTANASQTTVINSSLVAVSTFNSSSYRQHNINAIILSICDFESSDTYDALAVLSMLGNTIILASAIKTSPDSNNHIRIDRLIQNHPKLYLGNKKPRIYHGNRMIIDKN